MTLFNQQFLSTFLRHQPFDLPDSMIYYILKNPASAKVYQKLIQCCKYFFVKNPILVIHCLEISDDGWKICSNHGNCEEDKFHQAIDSKKFSNCKIWIDYQIQIISSDSKAAPDLIPNIYQCDAAILFFENQRMSLQQFLLYAEKAEACRMDNVILSSDVCAEIPLEEIVENLPNILRIHFDYDPNSKNVTSDTVTKLLQIPHFGNVEEFYILCVSEIFDIDTIYDYYKNNRSRFTFGVHYRNGLSEASVKKLDGIGKDILDYKFYNNMSPLIVYSEQNTDDYNALMKLCEKLFMGKIC